MKMRELHIVPLAQQTLAADSDPPIPSPTEVDDPVLPAVLSEIADSDRARYRSLGSSRLRERDWGWHLGIVLTV
jgi:hypothetical protein